MVKLKGASIMLLGYKGRVRNIPPNVLIYLKIMANLDMGKGYCDTLYERNNHNIICNALDTYNYIKLR